MAHYKSPCLGPDIANLNQSVDTKMQKTRFLSKIRGFKPIVRLQEQQCNMPQLSFEMMLSHSSSKHSFIQ